MEIAMNIQNKAQNECQRICQFNRIIAKFPISAIIYDEIDIVLLQIRLAINFVSNSFALSISIPHH